MNSLACCAFRTSASTCSKLDPSASLISQFLFFRLMWSTPPLLPCLKLKTLETALTQQSHLSPTWIPCRGILISVSSICHLIYLQLYLIFWDTAAQTSHMACRALGGTPVSPASCHATSHWCSCYSHRKYTIPSGSHVLLPLHILFSLHGILFPAGLVRIS